MELSVLQCCCLILNLTLVSILRKCLEKLFTFFFGPEKGINLVINLVQFSLLFS